MREFKAEVMLKKRRYTSTSTKDILLKPGQYNCLFLDRVTAYIYTELIENLAIYVVQHGS